MDPARKIRIGNKLYFGEDESMVAEVIDNTTSRGRTLRFLFDGDHEVFKQTLYSLGETPLPKYIQRPVEPDDAERFQAIFAKNEGAVVAPAANLHFSRELMKRMEIKGVNFAFITLYVGLGGFREIDVEDLTKHKMDSERIVVEEEAANIVNEAKDKGKRFVPSGLPLCGLSRAPSELPATLNPTTAGPIALFFLPTNSVWPIVCWPIFICLIQPC